ncbi:MAG: hypothetical protein AB1546_07800 [bacterium]
MPGFKTVESESAFWDESNLTDYFDFDNPLKVDIPPKKSYIVDWLRCLNRLSSIVERLR